jgi:hypothetical protein
MTLKLKILTILLLVSMFGLTFPSPASSSLPVEVPEASNPQFMSSLVVNFDSPTLTQKQRSRAIAFVEHAVSGGVVAAPAQTNVIDCNRSYAFGDPNGTYTVQRACSSSVAPWGFKISAPLCGLAISNVTETGMSWTLNGVVKPRQAPHVVGCAYQFHGSYNPVQPPDRVTYSDTFTFRIVASGSTGTARLHISGTLVFDTPCSPTSC